MKSNKDLCAQSFKPLLTRNTLSLVKIILFFAYNHMATGDNCLAFLLKKITINKKDTVHLFQNTVSIFKNQLSLVEFSQI